MKKTTIASSLLVLALGVNTTEAANATDNQDIKQEIRQLKNQVNEQQSQLEALADALEKRPASGDSTGGEWYKKTTIGGYAEHHFNHFKNSDDKIDAHRFVLFVSHEFSDKVSFFSELELEHSLSGEGKPGEMELEQAYIHWQYTHHHALIMGQFLIPVGIMNETHEPDTFYGVERNGVEKNIIPATWWETGAMLQGEIAKGLSYNLALHSGLKVKPAQNSLGSIRSGRQKSAKATAEDWAYTGRLRYRHRGLDVAATYQYQQDISQGSSSENNSATLLSLYADYQLGGFDLRALWASWDIDGKIPAASGQDEQTGYYIEAGYKIMPNLGFFLRLAEYDNQAGDNNASEVEVTTVGANYWLVDNVAIKIDYQDVDASPSGGKDSINLGIGWSF